MSRLTNLKLVVSDPTPEQIEKAVAESNASTLANFFVDNLREVPFDQDDPKGKTFDGFPTETAARNARADVSVATGRLGWGKEKNTRGRRLAPTKTLIQNTGKNSWALIVIRIRD
jgi:hypothetical protein